MSFGRLPFRFTHSKLKTEWAMSFFKKSLHIFRLAQYDQRAVFRVPQYCGNYVLIFFLKNDIEGEGSPKDALRLKWSGLGTYVGPFNWNHDKFTEGF